MSLIERTPRGSIVLLEQIVFKGDKVADIDEIRKKARNWLNKKLPPYIEKYGPSVCFNMEGSEHTLEENGFKASIGLGIRHMNEFSGGRLYIEYLTEEGYHMVNYKREEVNGNQGRKNDKKRI